MIDAVGRLVDDGPVCCSFSDLIVGKHTGDVGGQTEGDAGGQTKGDAGGQTKGDAGGQTKGDAGGQTKGDSGTDDDAADNVDEDGLNPNQVRAVESSDNPLALIWGPPGTI